MSYARLAEPPLPPLPRRPVESIPMKSFFLRPADATHKRPPMTPTRRRKLLLSYAPDWSVPEPIDHTTSLTIITGSLLSCWRMSGLSPQVLYQFNLYLLSALFFSLDKVEGYRRVFSLEDTSCVTCPVSFIRVIHPVHLYIDYAIRECPLSSYVSTYGLILPIVMHYMNVFQ